MLRRTFVFITFLFSQLLMTSVIADDQMIGPVQPEIIPPIVMPEEIIVSDILNDELSPEEAESLEKILSGDGIDEPEELLDQNEVTSGPVLKMDKETIEAELLKETPAPNQLICEDKFINSPPFYISSTTSKSDKFGSSPIVDSSSKTIAIENFRNETGAAAKRIARGSIVTIRGENREEFERRIREDDEGFRVPVKVEKANDTYTRFNREKSKFVAKDDEGYLWSKSMKAPTEENTFVLTEDTFLTPDNPDSNLKGKGLKPVLNAEGQFKTKSCCPNASKAGDTDQVDIERSCTTSYLYTVIGESGSQELNGTVVAIDHSCFDKDIRPLDDSSKNQFENLMGFLNENYDQALTLGDMEFNDFGRARLPLGEESNTTAAVAGQGIGNKFVYYKNGDQFQSDNWAKPTTICSLYNLTDKFYDACIQKEGRSLADCQARVGDLSFVTPGEKSNGKDLLGHSSHSNGLCIDLRPFRNDESYSGTTVGGAGYDREINEEFIDMAKEMGASPIYLNDSKIKNSTYMADHADHMHICFPETNETVAASCSSRRERTVASSELPQGE